MPKKLAIIAFAGLFGAVLGFIAIGLVAADGLPISNEQIYKVDKTTETNSQSAEVNGTGAVFTDLSALDSGRLPVPLYVAIPAVSTVVGITVGLIVVAAARRRS
ncbi:hypothetical protein ACFVJR_26975 [Nocardia salmonicida]|uniref:hypothetical protein n=1 Tax=Nocardia salmonicida TaxID=53431 RepID=UPI0036322415